MIPGTVSTAGIVALVFLGWSVGTVHADPVSSPLMRRIAGGAFAPFYGGKEDKPVRVAPFQLDAHQVTNEAFRRFVVATPRFQRSRIARLFADTEYLSHWAGDSALGPSAGSRQPVVFVSWFAARAYCEHRGARLPTEVEWELAAQADGTHRDAHRDPSFVRTLLDWYSRPAHTLGDVRSSKPNVFGLHDMHGLVWEWTKDFNASIVSADDRARADDQMQRVCGGAATGSKDPADYAAFMRYAFRSSLKASYTVHNLGFRCAKSAE